MRALSLQELNWVSGGEPEAGENPPTSLTGDDTGSNDAAEAAAASAADGGSTQPKTPPANCTPSQTNANVWVCQAPVPGVCVLVDTTTGKSTVATGSKCK